MDLEDDYDKHGQLHDVITGQCYDDSDIVDEGKILFGIREKSDGWIIILWLFW